MLRWALVGDILVAALAVVLAAVVATGYRNASATPLVRRLTLHLPDYPPSARPIRIVLVSDLHVHGPETPPARVERLVTQVNGLHPDVDVIAGDFIGGGSVGAQYPPAAAIAPLGRLQATFGAFAILGNNDFPADQVVPALRQARIRVLSNEATEVGPIALGGLDGRFLLAPAVLRAERAKTYAELRRTPGIKVLVSHSPDEIMAAPPWVRLILACLILGGSAQGIWGNMVLRVVGVAIIAWAAWERGDQPLSTSAKLLLGLAIFTIVIVALQMIPLPPEIWSHIGPRASIAESFHALGMPLPPEPLSLTPAAGFDALLGIIPPLAIICAMVRLKAYRPQLLAVALIAATVAGIALGALQVASSNGSELSPWYLYEDTNSGNAVGFFANANHMAALLVITIPFLAAIVAASKTTRLQRYSAIVAVTIGLAIVIIVGLALNGSLAGYGMALPVIAASALLLLPATSRLRFWILLLAGLLVIGAVTALETTPLGGRTIGEEATSSVESRAQIMSISLRATQDFMPFGSGLGSFPDVYHLYERPEQVNDVMVVHVHDDYVEVALELGIAGIILMLLFMAWWVVAVARAWRTAETGPFARAATIASAAILVHSIVEFPLRTAAIAACFGMCLALLADSRAAPPKEKAALRSKRHVEFR